MGGIAGGQGAPDLGASRHDARIGAQAGWTQAGALAAARRFPLEPALTQFPPLLSPPLALFCHAVTVGKHSGRAPTYWMSLAAPLLQPRCAAGLLPLPVYCYTAGSLRAATAAPSRAGPAPAAVVARLAQAMLQPSLPHVPHPAAPALRIHPPLHRRQLRVSQKEALASLLASAVPPDLDAVTFLALLLASSLVFQCCCSSLTAPLCLSICLAATCTSAPSCPLANFLIR